jgi:hypothetical protein
MIANLPSQLYLDTLLQYYEEEVQGEAYFNGIADRLSEPDHQAKMQLMAKVEKFVAAVVLPLVRKYDLKPEPHDFARTKTISRKCCRANNWCRGKNLLCFLPATAGSDSSSTRMRQLLSPPCSQT